MKIFPLLLSAILLLQVFTEALAISEPAHDLTQMNKELEEKAILGNPVPDKINCGYACSRRCSKASRKNVCGRACLACCAKCKCVPPGFYGNKEACPCYASLKTTGNRPKCP